MTTRDEQKKILMDYFTRMGISTSCVVCGSEDWSIGRTGPEFEIENERSVVPVEIICNFCGRIVSYDSYVVGNA